MASRVATAYHPCDDRIARRRGRELAGSRTTTLATLLEGSIGSRAGSAAAHVRLVAGSGLAEGLRCDPDPRLSRACGRRDRSGLVRSLHGEP
jgi:hypothetical protein